MNRAEPAAPGQQRIAAGPASAAVAAVGPLSKVVLAGRALHRRFVRGDRYAGYQLAQGISAYLAPDYVFMESGRAWTHDTEFVATYREIGDDRYLRTADKKWFLRELARSSAGIPGVIAECGSFKGSSAYFMAEATHCTGKQLHLFDSWQGLSAPVGEDGTNWKTGDLTATEADCLAVLAPFADRVVAHRGWIPDRFGDVEDLKFSLLHVDVDLYEPHRDALEFFWPRLSDGAVVVFDDHGSSYCPGAHRAVEEFFGPLGLKVIGAPTGQAFLFKPRQG